MSARILVIGQLPPPVHGSNVMTERFMAALLSNGYEAEIVEKTFSKSMDEVGKVSYRKALMVPDLCRRVTVAVRNRRPELCVYFLSVGLQSLLVDCLILRLLRKRQVPYVLYFHGQGYRAYESSRNLLVRSVVRGALVNAFGGLVLGGRLKGDVNHCIPDTRLYLLPNGIPTVDTTQREMVEDTDDVVRITFLSNLIPSKGPMRFLMLAKLICESEPCVRFVMAGRHTTENYLQDLKDFIHRENLVGCVDLPGPVYGMDKELLLSKTDILVFPTTKDVFGLVNVEAMQWAIPVVSSPVGAIPDVIQDGVNGFIVDPDDIQLLADRVLQLVRDKELRRSMGNAGRELFKRNYSLEAYTRNVRGAIECILKEMG